MKYKGGFYMKRNLAAISIYIIRLYTATIIMLNVFVTLFNLQKEDFLSRQFIPSIIVFTVFTGIHIKYLKKTKE